MLCQQVDQRLGKPLALVVPSDEFESEVPSDKFPILSDEGDTGTNETVPVSFGGPGVMDETKRTLEGLKSNIKKH